MIGETRKGRAGGFPGRSAQSRYAAQLNVKDRVSMNDNLFPTGVFVHETRQNLTLQFNDDGSYIVREGNVVDATGTYSISGNQYTEDTDYLPCKHARTATYTWTFDGRILTFELVGEDNCIERRESLDGVAWMKQG